MALRSVRIPTQTTFTISQAPRLLSYTTYAVIEQKMNIPNISTSPPDIAALRQFVSQNGLIRCTVSTEHMCRSRGVSASLALLQYRELPPRRLVECLHLPILFKLLSLSETSRSLNCAPTPRRSNSISFPFAELLSTAVGDVGLSMLVIMAAEGGLGCPTA